jgi:hypothetical protein
MKGMPYSFILIPNNDTNMKNQKWIKTNATYPVESWKFVV